MPHLVIDTRGDGCNKADTILRTGSPSCMVQLSEVEQIEFDKRRAEADKEIEMVMARAATNLEQSKRPQLWSNSKK